DFVWQLQPVQLQLLLGGQALQAAQQGQQAAVPGADADPYRQLPAVAAVGLQHPEQIRLAHMQGPLTADAQVRAALRILLPAQPGCGGVHLYSPWDCLRLHASLVSVAMGSARRWPGAASGLRIPHSVADSVRRPGRCRFSGGSASAPRDLDQQRVDPLEAAWQLVATATALALVMLQIAGLEGQGTLAGLQHQRCAGRQYGEIRQVFLAAGHSLAGDADDLVALAFAQ